MSKTARLAFILPSCRHSSESWNLAFFTAGLVQNHDLRYLAGRKAVRFQLSLE